MTKKNTIPVFILMLVFLLSGNSLLAEDKPAPANVAADMTTKLLKMENKTSQAGDITIYVMGDPDVAAILEELIGMEIGKSKIDKITMGDDLPKTKPTVLFIGDESKVDKAVEYTRAEKILSVTGIPNLISKGVSLGIGISETLNFKIIINLPASNQEGLDWNPAILKLATVIEDE
ncbi:MAG: YfiR family protein [Candidatus Zixiibacteriota bacterium]